MYILKRKPQIAHRGKLQPKKMEPQITQITQIIKIKKISEICEICGLKKQGGKHDVIPGIPGFDC